MAAKVLALFTLVIGILIKLFLTKLDFLSLPPRFTFNDDVCHLAGLGVGLLGSEDLALGKHGVLFITSGDLHNTFNHGAAAANPGGLWVLDMRSLGTAEPIKIIPDLLPEGRKLQGHGMDVSNSTNMVYSISHNGDHSSVDVFKIHYNMKCLETLPWSCTPLRLTFLKSIKSDLFPNYGINDVVEVEENQIYVTQWQPFSFPSRGLQNPDGWMEKLHGMLQLPISIFGIKLTSVFLCKWTEDSDPICEVASEQAFVGANGITVDNERSKVFVNDPIDKKITEMKRDKKTGRLTKVSEIDLPVAADNIEYDDEADEIIIATIPDIIACVKKGTDEDFPVPGGMMVAYKNAKTNDWELQDVLNHDGTKLSQVSAASRMSDMVVLGSPYSEGVLVCKLV